MKAKAHGALVSQPLLEALEGDLVLGDALLSPWETERSGDGADPGTDPGDALLLHIAPACGGACL